MLLQRVPALGSSDSTCPTAIQEWVALFGYKGSYPLLIKGISPTQSIFLPAIDIFFELQVRVFIILLRQTN